MKSVPTIRFSSFKDTWTEKSYGEIYSFYSTNSLSREKLNYENGTVKNIHYGDIHTKFATLFDIEQEQVPFINQEVNLEKIKEEAYCQEKDLIIADASEDYKDIGKTIEIINLNGEKVLAGLHTFLARPDKFQIATGFGGYLVQSNKFRKQVMIIAQGTKVLSLSTGRLAELSLHIPTLPEQQKIASFLSAVDEKIRQLKRKKELLEQYKKGVMQQIFSQKVRFKDENGDDFPKWKYLNGDQLFESITNKNHNSDLPILAITQEHGAIPRDQIDYNVTVTDKSIATYKVVEVGDFIISLRTFQGGIEYSNYKGICSPAYIVLRPSVQLNSHFYRIYFKTENYIRLLNKNLEGIRDGKMISYKYFSEIKLPFPSISEQQKIASFLSSLDKKIELVSQQVQQAQEFKKGLLQQMFV